MIHMTAEHYDENLREVKLVASGKSGLKLDTLDTLNQCLRRQPSLSFAFSFSSLLASTTSTIREKRHVS